MNIVNKILSKIKGQDYVIDNNVSLFYLLMLIFSRFLMLIRGYLSFIKSGRLFFIGSGVTIKARNLMKVGKGVTIDNDCYIDALSKDGILLGNNVSLGKRTVIECSGSLKHLGKGIKVGESVGLGRDCFYGCAGGIEIGDDTIIGNYVSFHSENHNISDLQIPIRLQGVNHKGIKIGKNCWIGAKVTVLDGAIVKDGCIIAAGAVVSAGVYEENGIYGGIPARLLKKRE
ncbi:transferase hexapeptide (six repeat-containing protein) [Pseudarcicella hirudinis]|uniref:Transferase hexapeptide (Six repeat-containing protein) n=1 Tax=Pseudarcicella hirudinis TaxID=1079859 RepID=A0A1I5YP48_9BACT|nr:acyltransferase [Pseudarcicella hirudinis]SFQ46014.1 transferase hexapeptide (six repeat-containing protein) [Pseudarcicella hirudinis]